MWKIAPQQRHVVRVQIPTQSEEQREAEKRPDKQAHRQGVHERHSRLGGMEQQSTDQAKAACEANSGPRSDQSVFPASGGDEKSGVEQSAEGENAHGKGNDFAEIKKQIPAS